MFRRLFRKLFFTVIVTALVLVPIRIALNQTLGLILRRVFANGTQCIVTLKRPRLYFFPLSATVRDVVIRHPTEGLEQGFRAKRVSIGLEFGKLFHKELMLKDLRLDGAQAASTQSESGFRNTLAFLFPEKSSASNAASPSRFAWLTTGWAVHVTNINIESASNRKRQLVLGSSDTYLSFDRVTLNFVEPTKDPDEPYDLTGFGGGFEAHDAEGRSFPLGDVTTKSMIGLGNLQVHEAIVRRRLTETEVGSEQLRLSGKMALRRPWTLEADIDSHLEKGYLESLLAKFSDTTPLPALTKLTGKANGSIIDPSFQGQLQLEIGDTPLIVSREGCSLKRLQAAVEASKRGLKLRQIVGDDVFEDGELDFGFDPAQTFQAKAKLKITPEQPFFARCFGGQSEPGETKVPPTVQALGEALSSSTMDLEVAGTLKPISAQGKLSSELRMKQLARRSELQADFSWMHDRVQLNVKERGVTPQVQSPVSADEGTNRSLRQTPFTVAYNSLVDIRADYNITEKLLAVEQFSFVRYPLQELLARLAPFASEGTFQALSNLLGSESQMNAQGQANLNFATKKYTGNGKVELVSLAAGPINIKRLRLPIEMSGTTINMSGVILETESGGVNGDLELRSGGEMNGTFEAINVPLGDLALIQDRFPDLSIGFSGKALLSGTLESPQYRLDAKLESFVRGEENSTRLSKVVVQGDRSSFALNGELLGNAVTVSLNYPFGREANEPIKLDMQCNHLPLNLLWSGLAESIDESSPPRNQLNGTLTYEGSKLDPLSGKGRLEIGSFSFVRDTVDIHNTEPLRAEINAGRLNFTRVRLAAQSRELTITGGIDRRSGWDAAIRGEWELSNVFRKAKLLEQVSGQIAMELAIRGPLAAPVVQGPLRIRNASLSFPLANTIVGAENGSIDSHFEAGNLRIDNIQARIGEGKLIGSGVILNVLDSKSLSTDVQAEFSQVVVEPVERFVTELSGKLRLLRAPNEPLKLTGEINLEQALYENKINLPRIIGSMTRYVVGSSSRGSSSGAAGKRGSEAGALQFDLRLFADSGIIIETNVVAAELRGDLRLRGNSNQPLLHGRISTVDGVFGFGPNDFQIISGDITFSELRNSLNPDLSILGETSVRAQDGDEHLVRMAIRGTLVQPEVDFSSESGMSRESVLGLMGLGTNLEALPGGFGRSTRSIAELLNPASNVSLPERISGLTGFSSVQIDTVLSPSSGELVPRLIAKRPLAGEVQLNLQTELSKSQVSTVSLDYPLTPYLSLITGWRSSGITSDESRDSGNLSIGLTYRMTFPGIKLLSPALTKEFQAESDR